MVLNKKAQGGIFGIMVLIYIIMLVLITIPIIKQSSDSSRDISHLDCTNTSISLFNQLTCIVVDSYLFFWVSGAFFAGVAYFIYTIARGHG
jgi:hypothetical protein